MTDYVGSTSIPITFLSIPYPYDLAQNSDSRSRTFLMFSLSNILLACVSSENLKLRIWTTSLHEFGHLI